MAVWDDFLTDRDKQIFGQAGFGNQMPFGEKTALLIIDVMYDFCGHKRQPIDVSVQNWNHSCG